MSTPRRLRWGGPESASPTHPYRDTALVYGGLAAVVILVAWLTGGGLARAVVIAAAFYAIATGWSFVRIHQRSRRARRELSSDRVRS